MIILINHRVKCFISRVRADINWIPQFQEVLIVDVTYIDPKDLDGTFIQYFNIQYFNGEIRQTINNSHISY